MVGRATLTIVRSTMVMKYATTNSAKARQRRTADSEPTCAIWVGVGAAMGGGDGVRRRSSARSERGLTGAIVSLLSGCRALRQLKHRAEAGLSDEFAAPLVLEPPGGHSWWKRNR